MSNFHSTISRREFMKVIGLSGAAVGAASLTAPTFHDLDELKSADQPLYKKAWWTKEVDEPTVPIDWSAVVRSDSSINGHSGIPYIPWPGQKVMDYQPSGNALLSPTGGGLRRPEVIEFMKTKFPNWPGDSLQDCAFRETVGITNPNATFLMSKKSPRYNVLGFPKYEGTPEENYIMLRNIVRLCGVPKLATMEITETTKKMFWLNHPRLKGTQEIVFEDVPEAYETKTKSVIPSKNKYVMTCTSLSSTVTMRRLPSLHEYAGPKGVLSNWGMAKIQEFLWSLGYECNMTSDFMNWHLSSIMGGGGEHNRMTGSMLPLQGATCQGSGPLITDLPLAINKPIDAGTFRFCKTCGLCAENCPPQSIWKGDPSWDHTVITGSPPGYEGYRMDARECIHCRACVPVCPFNAPRDSWIHYFVAGTTAVTPIFNGFFTSLEESFGYGFFDPGTFWTEDEQPVYGFLGDMLKY